MQVIKHKDLREFILGLDYEEQDTLDVLVKFKTQYIYTARISYDVYGCCWHCRSKQTTGGSVYSTMFDYRNVRVQIDDTLKEYRGFTNDTHITDEINVPPSAISFWATYARASDSTTEPLAEQVLTWLSDSTGE